MNKKLNIEYKPTGQFEETRFEKNHNISFKNSDEGNPYCCTGNSRLGNDVSICQIPFSEHVRD